MEGIEVKPYLDGKITSEQEIQQSGLKSASNSDELLQDEDVELLCLHQSTSSQYPLNIKKVNKSRIQWFKLFISLCTEDSDDSIDAILNHSKLIMPSGFKNTKNKLCRYFEHTIECLYKRFERLSMFKNVFCVIYEDTRSMIPSEMIMNAAFERFCTQELAKLLRNQEWSKIVIFGTLLCELTATYHGYSTLFIEEFNAFIKEIIKSALSGTQDACAAFKLILNQLTKSKPVFEEIDRGYLTILDTLLGDEDFKDKATTIKTCLNKHFDNNWKDRVEFKLEIDNSQKCKDFEEYLNSKSKGSNDCCEFFVDATTNELEYFARKFIKFAIKNPKEIKILGTIATKYKAIMLRVRKFIREVVKSLNSEFEVMKENEKVDSVIFLNLGKLLGELYVSENEIVKIGFMANYLNYLKENGEFITLTTTLKLCGHEFKNKVPKQYEKLMNSFIFAEIIEDEITKMIENLDDESLLYQSRLFKPAESANKFLNLKTVFNGILKNQDVSFSYELNQMLHINTKGLINMIISSLQKPDANVIEVAKLLKSLFDFTFKIEKFTKRLKTQLNSKITDLSEADNLQDMKTLGMLIAELKNLHVIDDDSQELWLEEVKTFESDDIFEVMEVYIDVIKAMIITIQIQDYEKLQEVHQYLKVTSKSLESSNTEVAIRIKSKIVPILQNIVLKSVTPSTSELLFKIRLGHKIQGLPKDMPESNQNILDVQDFAKIFCLNAISSHHFTANFTYAIKFLTTGPKGEVFIQSVRDALSSNLIPNVFFFESDEVIGTFELIVHLFKEYTLSESEIDLFLKNILKHQNLGMFKDCTRIFIEDLQQLVADETWRIARRFSHSLRYSIKEVLKKLRKLDVAERKANNSGVLQKRASNVEAAGNESKDVADLSKKVKNMKIKKVEEVNNAEGQLVAKSNFKIRILPKREDLESVPEGSLEDLEQNGGASIVNAEIKLNLEDLVQQLIQTYKTDKQSIKSSKHKLKSSSVDSTDQESPDILKLYNLILPIITLSTSRFKKCAITIYKWTIEDSSLKQQVKELIELLAKELQANHKQLLMDVAKDLTDECAIIRKAQSARKPKRIEEMSQQRSSFILTSRAVVPFFEKHQIYDILLCMLSYIRDGNRIAFEMFLDIIEGMENVFEDDCKERDDFVTSCIAVLEYAANFKNVDEEMIRKAIKMTKFLKSLNINQDALEGQVLYTGQDSNNVVSNLMKKPKKRTKNPKMSGQSSVNSSQSGQSSGTSSQVAITNSSIVADPPVNFSADAKIMFYISQLQSSNVEQIASKVSPFLVKNFSNQRFLEVLLQQGISDQKHINPVIDLFNLLSKTISFKKSLVQITAEISSKFLNLCIDCENQEQKMMNLTKFTVAFEPNIQNSFWYQLWQQLAEFIKQNYPNALKLLVLLMTEKIDMLCNIKEHKKLIRQIVVLFKNKLAVEQDEKLIEKMKILIKTIENGMEASKNNNQVNLGPD
ncbi:unnamed protein product [Chironomus riparius]|uniref:Uncharacterized protein n=1 Tax=Chironomus riparius TaxID=315576 RepID=A0A9N9S5G7_9DIPT|nr:unnamed protein product [Chironomus riparius]